VVNRPFDLSADPGDLTLQCRDAGMQLGDAQPVEILPDQLGQRIAGLQRRVVKLHGGQR
jgi:hypothetical protein